jgi:hemin uptake protein HemP
MFRTLTEFGIMTSKTNSISDLPPPKERELLRLTPKAQPASHYTSNDLFKGQSEILIEHQGAEYRLRITRSGGLILTK